MAVLAANDEALGRAKAERLWAEGVRSPAASEPEPRTRAFAAAALARFVELQEATPGIHRDEQEGAHLSATQLNVQPFRGIFEVIQNADDLGATLVSLTIREADGKWVLFAAHDGAPVRAVDALAMSKAYVSTKRDTASAKGRFGIGLKTLLAVGSRLEIHNHPWHFAVANGELWPVDPVEFTEATGIRTLLVLDLDESFDLGACQEWIAMQGSGALVFLNSVRRVELRAEGQTDPLATLTLSEEQRQEAVFDLAAGGLTGVVSRLRGPGPLDVWTRYLVEVPSPAGVQRAHKATARTTELAIAVPEFGGEAQLFAGLPLEIQCHLPMSLCAEFDPDTSRGHLLQSRWNEELLDRLADFAAAVAMRRAREAARSVWRSVPLSAEANAPGGHQWLRQRLDRLVNLVSHRLREELRFELSDGTWSLADLAYETPLLEGLLTSQDLKTLQPDHRPVDEDLRDDGRWRQVLDHLALSRLVGAETTVGLLTGADESIVSRGGQWFVEFAAAIIAGGAGERLAAVKGILLKDGRLIARPNPKAPEALLSPQPTSVGLRSALGLEAQLDPAYFGESAPAAAVRTWLGRALIREPATCRQVLEALVARGGSVPLHLTDEHLLLLRDELESVSHDDARSLGTRIGHAISVDGAVFDGAGGHRVATRPADAYLPTQLERTADGWGTAAARTPGIIWVDPRYENVVRGSGRDQRGARALFTLLGVETAPRLLPAPQSLERRGVPAFAIKQPPPTQERVLARLRRSGTPPTHLRDDHLSPDLDAVIADIAAMKAGKLRSKRARALVSTLNRAWQRLYSERDRATAVYSLWTWERSGQVPATWLARAASSTWLTNRKRQARAPYQLVCPCPATEALYGRDPTVYASELDSGDARMPAVAALDIVTEPLISSIVSQLEALRERGSGKTLEAQIARIYVALAARVPNRQVGPTDLVGDLTVAQLRYRFGVDPAQPGLLRVDGRWLPIPRVFRGPRIFGHRRPFVPEGASVDALWRVLGLRTPRLEDHVDTLRELAREPLPAADTGTLISTYRSMAQLVASMKRSELAALAKLPLWNGHRWVRERPVYATDAPDLAEGLSRLATLWRPPCAIDTLGALTEALRVTQVTEDQIRVLGGAARAVVAGAEHRDRFAAAVGHLHAYLAEHDPKLSAAIRVPWEALSSARLGILDDLHVEVQLKDRTVNVPVRVHASVTPQPALFVANASDLGQHLLGGRAVASFFTGDRAKLALAWSVSWQAAADGLQASEVHLADEDQTGRDQMADLAARAPVGVGRANPPRPDIVSAKPRTHKSTTPPPPPPRRLKTPAQLAAVSVAAENVGGPTGGTKVPKTRGLTSHPAKAPVLPGYSPRNQVSGQIQYTEAEKENLAWLAVQAALRLSDDVAIADFRSRRGIGADAVDELRRYIEIKASGRDVPDSVTLPASEATRALEQGQDFLLAVVGGLEENEETTVRLISDPLRTLAWQRDTGITLAGVRSRPARVVRFEERASS